MRRLLAVLLVLGLGGCSLWSPRPARGDALSVGQGGFEFGAKGPAAFAPGQQFIDAIPVITNRSDADIKIRSVAPLRAGPSKVGTVVRTLLGPRPVGVAPVIAGGLYLTYPPVLDRGKRGGCAVQEIEHPGDSVLEPGEEMFVLTWIRARAPGMFVMKGIRITYEHEGRTFYQDVDYTLKAQVQERRDGGRKLSPGERPCADRADRIFAAR